MSIGENLRNPRFNDGISQLRPENEPLIVSYEVGFYFVAAGLKDPLDIVGPYRFQASKGCFLQDGPGSTPLEVPIRIAADRSLTVPKRVCEEPLDSTQGVGFYLLPLVIEEEQVFIDEMIDLALVGQQQTQTAVYFSIIESDRCLEIRGHTGAYNAVVTVHGSAMKHPLLA